MFENKYLNLGYISVASFIFGIVISVSFVKAESSLESNIDSSQSYTIEKIATSEEKESDQEDIGEGELEEFEIRIKGMTCVNCENTVKEALLKCAGVKTALVSHEEGNAVIEADVDMIDGDEIVNAIEKAGFSFVEGE